MVAPERHTRAPVDLHSPVDENDVHPTPSGLTITVPDFADRTPLIKRVAIFALIVLLLAYVVLSYVQSRDNAKLLGSQQAQLNNQSKALKQVTDDLKRTLEELKTARTERQGLIKIAIAQNEEIKRLGGTPVDVLGVASSSRQPTSTQTTPAPGTSRAPNPAPAPKPQPKPSPTTQPKPTPSPTPAPPPSPKPVVGCTPKLPVLGAVCV